MKNVKKKADSKNTESSLIFYDPFEQMHQMQKSMDNLFDSMFGVARLENGSVHTLPLSAELKSTPQAYLVDINIPDMKKEDFDIEVYPHVLRIFANKKHEDKSKKNYSYSSSSYSRQFVLAQEADPRKVNAQYKNGVLSIQIAKAKKRVSNKIIVK